MFSKRLKLVAGFNIFFLVGFVLLTFCVGLSPTINKFGLYQPAIIIFSIASVLTATLMVLMSGQPNSKLEKYYPFAAIGLFVVAFGVQLIIAKALTSTGYTWDTEQIFKQASRYAVQGSISPDFIDYMKNNPNNIGLLTGLGLYLRAVHHFGVSNLLAAGVILNVCILFIAQIITFLVAHMLYGKRIALISILFSFIFISLSLYVQTPYTDTLTIVFPISIFFIGLQFIKSQSRPVRLLLAGLIGSLATIGYIIKPTVVIALIAILVTVAFWLYSSRDSQPLRKTLPQAGYYLAGLAVCAGLTFLVFGKVVDASRVLPYKYAVASQSSKPLTLFAAMGMRSTINGTSVNYGGYDADLSNAVVKLQSQTAKKNFAEDAIRQQLSAYGPFGYLDFVGHKIKWITSDATFFAYGEGDNSHVKFVYKDPVSRFIRQFMYIDGRYYLTFGNALQVFWVCLLLLISMQLFFVTMSRSSRYNIYMSTLRLMILGILTFLVLFEGRSRYILLYLPIFIILALYTLRWFKEPDTAALVKA